MRRCCATVARSTRLHLSARAPNHAVLAMRQSQSKGFSTDSADTKKPVPTIVSLDRRGLIKTPEEAPMVTREGETALIKELKRLIGVRGPLTVADYMGQCLGHPEHGYYMKRDVFGRTGDFVTSPDVSQLFGELLGVWCVATWESMGSPEAFRIAELGPGRGALMDNFLRVIRRFPKFKKALQGVHMVENSRIMRDFQAGRLGVTLKAPETPEGVKSESVINSIKDREMTGRTPEGINVSWHWSVRDIPDDVPIITVANEFFDALPVHQFRYTEKGWCEKMVDVNLDADSDYHLRFVLSAGPTPQAASFLPPSLFPVPPSNHPNKEAVEVSPVSIGVMEEMTRRLRRKGGAFLAIDYGQDSLPKESLQAVHKHKYVHALSTPGDNDLTCHVDFASLREAALRVNGEKREDYQHEVKAWGLVRQRILLRECGLQQRLEDLLKTIKDEEQQEAVFEGAVRLIDEEEETGMGSHFKCLCIASEDVPLPLGFYADE